MGKIQTKKEKQENDPNPREPGMETEINGEDRRENEVSKRFLEINV